MGSEMCIRDRRGRVENKEGRGREERVCAYKPSHFSERSNASAGLDIDLYKPGHLAVVDRKPRSAGADKAGRDATSGAPVGLFLGFGSTARGQHLPQCGPLLAARVVLTDEYRLLGLAITIDTAQPPGPICVA